MRVELVSEDKTNETIARRIGDGWFLPKLFQVSRTKSPYWFERYRTYMENIVCGIEQTIILAQTRKLDTRPTFSTVSLYTSLLPADAASILTATNQNQGWDKIFSEGTKNLVTTEQIGGHLYQHFFVGEVTNRAYHLDVVTLEQQQKKDIQTNL